MASGSTTDLTLPTTGLAPPSIERSVSRSSVRSITSLNAWNRLSIISSATDNDVPTLKRYGLHVANDSRPSSPSTDVSSVTTCDSLAYAELMHSEAARFEVSDTLPEMKSFATPANTLFSHESWDLYLERVFQLGACDTIEIRLSATEMDSPLLVSNSEIMISGTEYMSEDEWRDYENVIIEEAHETPSRKISLPAVPSRWKKSRLPKTSSKSVSYQPYSPFAESLNKSTQPSAGPSVEVSDTPVVPIRPLSFVQIDMDDELNLPPSISVTPPQDRSSSEKVTWRESSSEDERTTMTPIDASQSSTLAPPPTQVADLENGLVTRSVTNAGQTTPSRYVMVGSYPKWFATSKPAIRSRPKSIRSRRAPGVLRKNAKTSARRPSVAARPKASSSAPVTYEEDVANGVMTRIVSNAKESTPRRVAMNDSGFPLFLRQSTALETVSEKPEMMLGDGDVITVEAPGILVRSPTVGVQRRRGRLSKKQR